MALTKVTYPSHISQTLYTVSFTLGFLDRAHIKVHTGNPAVQLAYTWPNNTQIQLAVPPTTTFYIQRIVPRSALLVDYSLGAIITDTALDTANLQHLMITEELTDDQESTNAAAISATNAEASAVASAASAATADTRADDSNTSALASAGSASAANIGAGAANTSAGEASTSAGLANTANLAAQAANVTSTAAAAVSLSAANFKGAWTTLGAIPLNVPSAVSHNGDFWQLLVNLGNISLSQPGVTADWQRIKTRTAGDPVAIVEWNHTTSTLQAQWGCTTVYPAAIPWDVKTFDIFLTNPLASIADADIYARTTDTGIAVTHGAWMTSTSNVLVRGVTQFMTTQNTLVIPSGQVEIALTVQLESSITNPSEQPLRDSFYLRSSLGTAAHWWVDPSSQKIKINAVAGADVSITHVNSRPQFRTGVVTYFIYNKADRVSVNW